MIDRSKDIVSLLSEGKSYEFIKKIHGVTFATISYHAKKNGLSRGSIKKHDWKKIEEYILAGGTLRGASKEFCVSKAAISKAKNSGRIYYPTIKDMNAEEYSAMIDGKRAKSWNRRRLKNRLVSEGLERLCVSCGLSEWMGSRISLEVDHIDGNSANNKISNLRLLCPNCHSQTSTWRGRNKIRYPTANVEIKL